jgi:PKHD-type hydroxylase
MIITISQIIDTSAVDAIRRDVAQLPFEAGRAGWAAGTVKRNSQAGAGGEAICEQLAGYLAAHALFALAARPKRIIGPLISRYRPGDAYGVHADDPVLDGARADLAFTLFLAEPADYDGGELVIQSAGGEEAFKLPAGDLVLYPATTLHRVERVSRGERLCAVGWVRSIIRGADQREILFDLDTARHTLFQRHGKTAEFDLLSKCSANLVRRWCDD